MILKFSSDSKRNMTWLDHSVKNYQSYKKQIILLSREGSVIPLNFQISLLRVAHNCLSSGLPFCYQTVLIGVIHVPGLLFMPHPSYFSPSHSETLTGIIFLQNQTLISKYAMFTFSNENNLDS